MSDTTPLLGLTKPVGGDSVSALRTAIGANADILDTRLGFVGTSIIDTSESRANTAYGLLTTPDHVPSVVVPANAIVQIRFMALWQRSLSAADARAAIFIGSSQLTKATDSALGAGMQEAQMNTANTHAIDQILATGAGGLFSTDSVSGGAPTSFPTTGILLGGGNKAVNEGSGSQPQYGAAEVHGLTAGTYDISVQYKTSTGSLTVKNRRLWVRVLVS